jgi:hypothetical protein
LLTHVASHAGLVVLDRPNMRRELVTGKSPTQTSRTRAILSALRSKIRVMRGQALSGQLLHDLGVDLLFCPFTAPTYVPARAMGGEGRRVLSAVLQKCSIEHANGECIELFPANVVPQAHTTQSGWGLKSTGVFRWRLTVMGVCSQPRWPTENFHCLGHLTCLRLK